MMGKRLDLLKEAFPKITTVAMLWKTEAGQLAAQVLDEPKRAPRLLDYNSGRMTSEAQEISRAPQTSKSNFSRTL